MNMSTQTNICAHMMCVQNTFFNHYNQAAKQRVPRGSQRLSTMPKGWCLHMKRWMKLTLDLNLLRTLNSVTFSLPLTQ